MKGGHNSHTCPPRRAEVSDYSGIDASAKEKNGFFETFRTKRAAGAARRGEPGMRPGEAETPEQMSGLSGLSGRPSAGAEMSGIALPTPLTLSIN